MAFEPNFTVSQVTGQPANVAFEDTSTGSDNDIAGRVIYPIQANGIVLLPTGTTTAGILWTWPDLTTTVEDLLNKDYSLAVKVEWVDVDGNKLYELTKDCNFKMYNSLFNYSLVYQEANGLASLNSINWLTSRMALYLAINDSDTSVTDMSSIASGQDANDRGTYLRENPNLFK